jgi:hypothetical protein
LVLIPLLMKLEKPPAPYVSQEKAALLNELVPEFSTAAEWAQKETSKAVLEGIAKVVVEEDFRKAFVFAQPYGVEAVADDLSVVEAGLYTELGADVMLAEADIKYMDELENMGILVHVEATRLLNEGKGAEALKTMRNWMFFTRQFADRPFYAEKRWALDSMELAAHRMRDLVYCDMRRSQPSLTPDQLADINKPMGPRGYLSFDRLELPVADSIAAEQLAARVIENKGKPIEGVFGPTIAKIETRERPLRLFSAAAKWDSIAKLHAGWWDTNDMIRGVRQDWERRWKLESFDPALTSTTDYQKHVAKGPKFALLRVTMSKIEELFPMRADIECELGGTRSSIGAYAFFLKNKQFAPALSAVRRDYLPGQLSDKDPYTRNGFILFFVPMRDTPQVIRQDPKPYSIRIFPSGAFGFPDFALDLRDDVFVVYSVGRDGNDQRAKDIIQGRKGVPGDYLLFPPLLSLGRQALEEKGQLR